MHNVAVQIYTEAAMCFGRCGILLEEGSSK